MPPRIVISPDRYRNGPRPECEFVSTLTDSLDDVDRIEEWLKNNNIEYGYEGYIQSSESVKTQSNWWVPKEQDRILFALVWGIDDLMYNWKR